MRLKISARKSDLARLQAYMVGSALKKINPKIEIEFKFKESLGDINLTTPLWKIPEKGVFTEDFLGELINNETDMVVHSWKDLPTEVRTETAIVATLPRADQRDLLLVKKSHFAKLKSSKKMRVFSSSPRREYNLTNFFKEHLPFDLENVSFESVRGNIPTRVRKLLEANEVDGLIVAKAALDRLLTAPEAEFSEVQQLLRSYLEQLEFAALPLTINPNAAAQGALAIEIKKDRLDLHELLKQIDSPTTFQCAQKERDILASFGGGCHQKIGVAVLNRPYGEITILKGLTDGGKILDSRILSKVGSSLKFPESQLWSSEVIAKRDAIADWKLPEATNALYVSRSESWPETLKFDQYVWTAGLKTWKAMAQRGVWVHGCSEGMGEQEESLIDILAGQKLSWAKLTHDKGYEDGARHMPLVATYSLEPLDQYNSITNKECFYWSSGSQFLFVANKHPEILTKHHACGPGNTFKIIRDYLVEKNLYAEQKLNVYLDQDNWRQECTL